jgi:hypothetical protein
LIKELCLAISQGKLDEVAKLIDRDKNILTEKVQNIQETLVHVAIRFISKSSDLQIIKYILAQIDQLPTLQKQTILNAKNSQGQTALHLAMEIGQMEVAGLLLQAEIDYTATNIMGYDARDTLKAFFPQKLDEFDRLVAKKPARAENKTDTKESSFNLKASDSAPLLEKDSKKIRDRHSATTMAYSQSITANSASILSTIGSASGSSSDNIYTCEEKEKQVISAIQTHLKNP